MTKILKENEERQSDKPNSFINIGLLNQRKKAQHKGRIIQNSKSTLTKRIVGGLL